VRYDLAGRPVAARRGAGQAAVLVGERDAQAVDLQLRHVVQGCVAGRGAQPAPDAFVEGAQVLLVVGVVQAEHRLEVHGALEAGGDPSTDALRRRLRRHQIGMRHLERAQLVHQRVELAVGDQRLVDEVVPLFVVADQAPQLLDTFGGSGLGGHDRGRPRDAN
jgi:hypothetical protein